MSGSGDKQRSIKTRTDYTDSDRFRIWSEIVADMEFMNIGYRAYHSHIFESFKKWESKGVEFKNPRGLKLFLDALKADDLYGFLGRKKYNPKGPQRRIVVSKISVLDAFLQEKFPKYSKSPPSGDSPVKYANLSESLFGSDNFKTDSAHKIEQIVQSLDGAFIHSPFFAREEISRMIHHMGESGWGFPLFLINSSPRSRYCIVHKVYLTICSSHYKTSVLEDSDFDPNLGSQLASQELKIKFPIEIWSGIGTVVPLEYDNPMVTVECALKHRGSGKPHFTTLTVEGRYDRLGDTFTVPESATATLSQNRQGVFGFCKNRDFFYSVADRTIYTEKFGDDIFDMKEKLGLEI